MRVIGAVDDSVKILRAAAAYLRRHARITATRPTITQMALPFDTQPAPDESGIRFAGPSEFSWNMADVKARDDQIVRWRQQGVTHKEIALRLCCSRQRVGQLLERIQERRAVVRACWCGQAIQERTGRTRTYCSPAHDPDSVAVGRNMLTQEQYGEMLTAQGDICAICKMPEARTDLGKTMMLSVDHCHRTGVVRELLCSRCNCLLGAVVDDPTLLGAAINYLVKHGEAEASHA